MTNNGYNSCIVQLEVVESTTADLDRIQVGACNNFGLDLDLPHPDTYLPETGILIVWSHMIMNNK